MARWHPDSAHTLDWAAIWVRRGDSNTTKGLWFSYAIWWIRVRVPNPPRMCHTNWRNCARTAVSTFVCQIRNWTGTDSAIDTHNLGIGRMWRPMFLVDFVTVCNMNVCDALQMGNRLESIHVRWAPECHAHCDNPDSRWFVLAMWQSMLNPIPFHHAPERDCPLGPNTGQPHRRHSTNSTPTTSNSSARDDPAICQCYLWCRYKLQAEKKSKYRSIAISRIENWRNVEMCGLPSMSLAKLSKMLDTFDRLPIERVTLRHWL